MSLLNLVKQLYPSGRAFRLFRNSNFENLHRAFNENLDTWKTSTDGILDKILPDNPNFSEDDATVWEQFLGLPGGGTFDQRKLAISRRLNHPGNTLGRMSESYFQAQLRAAGFDVYVHQNRFPDGLGGIMVINPGTGTGSYAEHGNAAHGNAVHGTTGFPFDSIIANHIDKTLEPSATYTNPQLRATFFIGAQQFPNLANIPASREEEFRKLILTLKGQHLIGYLLVNYI